MAKTICIIQARQGSTRLSGKAMVRIKGQTVLGWVVKRLIAVNLLSPVIDELIIATTTKPVDNIIESWCEKHKVKCFRGDEHNVLKRYYDCAKIHKADWILRITADCPFIDPVMVWGLLTKEPRKRYQALAVNRGGIIDGYDAELFSFQELERVYNIGPSEHVTTKMRNAGSDIDDYGTKFDFSGLKLSLDTEEDLRRLSKYAELI